MGIVSRNVCHFYSKTLSSSQSSSLLIFVSSLLYVVYIGMISRKVYRVYSGLGTTDSVTVLIVAGSYCAIFISAVL